MIAGDYFFDDGKSRKFWSIKQRGKKQTVRHGRLGTAGRETSKEFDSPKIAVVDTEKLIAQKLKKGYVEIDPTRLTITRRKGLRKATEAQVKKFEKQLGAKLPSQYREFLLTQNGGDPKPMDASLLVTPDDRSVMAGSFFGLYAKAKPAESLSSALQDIAPHLPKGHLPICGIYTLHSFTISLHRNPGSVYYWDEFEEPLKTNAEGKGVFAESQSVLAAGSFNEFLTRIAMGIEAEEKKSKEPPSTPAAEEYVLPIPEPRSGSRISKRRREEIMHWVYGGGDERTAVFEQGEELMRTKSYKAGDAFIEKYVRKIDRETKKFIKGLTDRHELQYFADNWNWDGGEEPMLALVKNPNADAGTLLQVYWYSCPEDMCFQYGALSEIDNEPDKNTFRIQRHVERRFQKSDYKTASFPFDPTSRISMWDRRDEFVRQIPDVMYQPIGGKKRRG